MTRRARGRGRIAAIPTTYAGTRFRSRLEARWAALFDGLGWRWEYEPAVELQAYIPDFLITTALGTSLLVECKPFTSLTGRDVAPAQAKIARSGWDGNALLVGARLFDCSVVGWYAAMRPDQKPAWREASIVLAGDTWGVGVGGLPEDVISPLLLIAWREAGNLTQWKPPHG